MIWKPCEKIFFSRTWVTGLSFLFFLFSTTDIFLSAAPHDENVSVSCVEENELAGEFPKRWLTSEARSKKLQEPVSLSWSHAPLRVSFTKFCRLQKIALVMDRRVNPELTVTQTFQNMSMIYLMRHALTVLEDPTHFTREPGGLYELSQIGDVLYVGPKPYVRKLQTLIYLQERKVPADARKIWMKKTVLTWEDFDRPRDILQKIAERYQIGVSNLKNVPHDLWWGNRLPEMTLTEQITLILGQFNLTYDVDSSGKMITIKPLNLSEITVTRMYPKDLEARLAEAKKVFGETEYYLKDNKLCVNAPVEVHQFLQAKKKSLEQINVGGFKSYVAASSAVKEGSLDTFRFSGMVKGPFFHILNELGRKGLSVQYDAQSMQDAGINPNVIISVEAKDFTAAELMREIARQGGCKLHVEGSKFIFYAK